MKLENIVIILVHPKYSENIGRACRAMLNNGVTSLRIVGDKNKYNTSQISKQAIHAYSIYEQCTFYDSIKEATADCVLSIGTTRRRGEKRANKLYFPEEVAAIFNKVTESVPLDTKEEGESGANNTDKTIPKAALLFGNEATGLTDAELNSCTQAATIPSSSLYPSLNLAASVQVFLYEIYKMHLASTLFQSTPSNLSKANTLKTIKGYTPIPLERLDATVETIACALKSIGFFKFTPSSNMEHFFRDILSRAVLSEGEAKYLEMIFNKIMGLTSKDYKDHKP